MGRQVIIWRLSSAGRVVNVRCDDAVGHMVTVVPALEVPSGAVLKLLYIV